MLLVAVLFRRPLTLLISVGGEEFKWRQPAQHQPALVHTVQLKPMIKAHYSGRMVSSGISDVVITSTYSEKTRLKS